MTGRSVERGTLRAWRAALRARLVDTGMSPDVADRWIAHWEAHGHPVSPTAWNAGFVWSSAFEWITDLHAFGLTPGDGKARD